MGGVKPMAAGKRVYRGRTKRRGRVLPGAAVLGSALLLAACGGRAADPVLNQSPFDMRLSCAHVAAERAANVRRIEDLRDERNFNRVRNLTRVPGAILGNPLTALALVDTSRAVYVEIDALEKRNGQLDRLEVEKACGVQAVAAAPEAPPAPSGPGVTDYEALIVAEETARVEAEALLEAATDAELEAASGAAPESAPAEEAAQAAQ